MPEYLSPGVYIQEVDSGPRPIEGVGTATAAFVGFAAAGPANRPILVTNWSQYVNTFGSLEEGGRRNPHIPGSYLSHSVYGYFLNGGGRCYVTRVVAPSTNTAKPQPLQLPSRSSKAIPSLTIVPKDTVNQDVEIDIIPASKSVVQSEGAQEKSGGEQHTKPEGANTPVQSEGPEKKSVEVPEKGAFTLRIKMGDLEEKYENLSMVKQGRNSVVEVVNRTSQLVQLLEAPSAAGTLVERAPEVGSYLLKMPPMAKVPQVQSQHFTGDVEARSGLEGLEIADDVTMVCCPDVMAAYRAGYIDRNGVKAVQLSMIAHCERMGDRMAIIDPLPDLSPQEVKRWREQEAGYDSKFAKLYYPWVKIADNGHMLDVPPSGYMAGVYARNDNERGVHKAPANEVVRGVLEACTPITKGEQDTLNPSGINCIRSFTGRGVRVWGARTLSSDPAWRYVNVRRLFNYVEKSIERGTQWVVFEPSDHFLWTAVIRDVSAFLTGAWRDGMLFGLTPEESFFVKCDEELNPPDVRDRGQLVIEIGLAPVKPAEFVIFRLRQWTNGGA